jgi:hypothetical protein
MADLTDSALPAGNALADGHTDDVPDRLSVPHLMELDLDGPTLEMLLAALTATDCDQFDSTDS